MNVVVKIIEHLWHSIRYQNTQKRVPIFDTQREYISYKNNHRKVYEVKGNMTQSDLDKQKAIQNWVESINQDGRFGKWQFEIIDQLA